MTETSAITNTHQQNINSGIAFAVTATLMFSIKPILIKLAYQFGGDAVSIMAIRAAFSLPFYLFMLLWICRKEEAREKVTRYGWQAALVGVLGYYLASYLDILSLNYISAQLERLLIFLFPSFVVLISWIFLKQKPQKSTFISIFLGYLGIGLIVAHDLTEFGAEVWLGSSLAICSALIFACYLVLSKKQIQRLGSQLFTCIGMGCAAVVILIHALTEQVEVVSMSIEFVAIGLIMAVFCTVLPSFLVAAAMARLTPSTLSLTSNVGPAITAGFAVILLDEAFTLFHAVGMALVVLSVVSLTSDKARKN
ncbi:DMT family transporter [Aliivibrio kagoshimensis]|uniref:DMT family transporter n=1 Tax=Aliivibrio kagoshimensis TaxID=2910230 RepID=UPI003D0C6EAD